jgi:flagellar hook-associated protein 3 FlgL
MSSSISSSTYSPLELMLASTSSLQDQYNTLEEQTTTGQVSQSYAGLGGVSSQVLDLNATSTQNTAYGQAITGAQAKASAMQSALTQLQSVVSKVASQALTLTGSNPTSTVQSVAQQAQQALSQVASLLNTQNGSEYVFAGADTSNPPVPSPNTITSSGLYTQIGAQLNALTTVPTSPAVGQVIANTVAIAGDTSAGTSIFSSYLNSGAASSAAGTVQVSGSQQVTLNLPANQNVGAVSDPSINGTGSAINDILRGLSVLANATGAMASNPDFATLVDNVQTTLTSAGQTLAQESGAIGVTQDTLTTAASQNASMNTALQTQLSSLTNVDMASAISKLQAVSNQLQASYNVISLARSMNLAQYLN